MAVITTGNHPKALWPGVYAFWGLNYEQHEKQWQYLVDTFDSNKKYEELVQSTSFGLAPIKAQGAGIEYDTHSQGYVTRATHVVYGLGYIVTREEMEDNLYSEVSMERAAMLAFSMNQTKETVVANMYNRAFNSSYTFGDGKEILATDHPNSTGGTYSNELNPAAALSEQAVEDLYIQIRKVENDRGLKISLRPRCLILPPDLEPEGHRIVDTKFQNDTANNAISFIQTSGMFPEGIKVNNYLTSATRWFIRTNLPSKRGGLCLFQRRAVEFTKDNDFDTENAKAKATERYSTTIADPRALFGSAAA